MEVWKDIKHYEGKYQVSSLGRVRSLPNKTNSGVRILSTNVITRGYLAVNLYSRSHAKVLTRRSVHLVVLETFVGPRPPGMVARHLDGVRTNNAVSNLKWGTPEENEADKLVHGTIQRGEDNKGGGKLKDEDVRQIKKELKEGVKSTRLAERYGVTPTLICHIKKGRQWSHIS